MNTLEQIDLFPPQALGDGLVLRNATLADIDAVVDLNHQVHDLEGYDYIGLWTRELMSGQHPTVAPSDTVVVEDTHTAKLVSVTTLISQTWYYGGIPIKVGQPEIVSTLPEYRRRGLVRKIFERMHAMSAAKGELIQGITGIPWFYRQFGYEMALHLDGGRGIYKQHFPKLPEGQSEPFTLRLATHADIPTLQRIYEQTVLTQLFAVERTPEIWAWELSGPERGTRAWLVWLIEDQTGKPIGYVRTGNVLYTPLFLVRELALLPEVGCLTVFPALVRGLLRVAEELYVNGKHPAKEAPYGVYFELGRDHPLYHAWQRDLLRVVEPYAWYIRVPDMLALLQHVQPALERNLANSLAAGYTGEIKLSFYRTGLHFKLNAGRLESIEAWQPDQPNDGDAALPDLTFLQLFCGRRRMQDLISTYPDAWANIPSQGVLNGLFPAFDFSLLQVA